MAHVRQQIRDRMQSVLLAGVTSTSGRVYTSRVYALSQLALPSVTISFDSERSSLITMGLRTMDRDVNIVVDVYASATSDLDDALDDICVEVEESIAGDFTMNGLAKSCILTSTDLSLTGGSDTPIGVARLNYTVSYITSISDVETAR
jgi:hypothetical protein